MSFRAKLRDRSARLFTYTLTAPSSSAIDEELALRAEHLMRFLAAVPIDAVNIPEVYDESRNRRVTQFDPKIEPREFALALRENLDVQIEFIIDRPVVYEPWETHEEWLRSTTSEYRLSNLLLVGGQSSSISYPGIPVPDAAARIREDYSNHESLTLGGITIPTRRDQSGKLDEPDRLVHKSTAGIEYFISQVIFDAESTISLLRDYAEIAERNDELMAKILLSFAPISAEPDIRFMEWWDVLIPAEIKAYLLRSDANVIERSIEVSKHHLKEVLRFVGDKSIDISLGINIEHVTKRNLEYAIALAKELYSIYNEYEQKQASDPPWMREA